MHETIMELTHRMVSMVCLTTMGERIDSLLKEINTSERSIHCMLNKITFMRLYMANNIFKEKCGSIIMDNFGGKPTLWMPYQQFITFHINQKLSDDELTYREEDEPKE